MLCPPARTRWWRPLLLPPAEAKPVNGAISTGQPCKACSLTETEEQEWGTVAALPNNFL